MRGEEEDLSFAEYGSRRLSASPTETVEDRELAKSSERLARREGFEPPTLRFEVCRETQETSVGCGVGRGRRLHGAAPRYAQTVPGGTAIGVAFEARTMGTRAGSRRGSS